MSIIATLGGGAVESGGAGEWEVEVLGSTSGVDMAMAEHLGGAS